MAKQLIIDLYGCDDVLLNDEAQIKSIAELMVASIGAEILEEHVRKFDPIGITYFAVISTSHFSIHTWPENAYAAVDLFSCTDFEQEAFVQKLREAFKAKRVQTKLIQRSISGNG